MALWREVGMSPILVKKEVAGFVLNRLQYALLAESYRLVEVSFLISVISSFCNFHIGNWNVQGMENFLNQKFLKYT